MSVSLPACFDEEAVTTAKISGNTQIGFLEDNGYLLAVYDGAFENGTNVTLKVLSEAERFEAVQSMPQYTGKSAFELVGSIVDLNADHYDGKLFTHPVVLEMKVPQKTINMDELGFYTAAYYNDELKKWIYYHPDFVVPETGIMQVTLDHFSWESS